VSDKAVLVIGGGIAGIQASIDLGNMGFKVHLVERSPSIGGRMAQLDKTFPTNDCSICILAPKMIECSQHPNINLLTYSELRKMKSRAKGFHVTVIRKPRYIDESKCTGCDKCAEVCPVELPNEFDMRLGKRKAAYKLFPQAVPNVYAIDKRGIPPCKDACPAGIEVQAYVSLIAMGKFREALDLVSQTIAFPATIGRICHHPCETACNRREIDEPISISALKRFVADHTVLPPPECAKRKRREKVAIVGSGPAGLTAAHDLSMHGYKVTVFESLPVAGGMLAVGIPEYRLPGKILSKEIQRIQDMGVELKLNTRVGKDVTIRHLLQEEFNAVLIAVGAHKDLKLDIPGEDLSGVMPAARFLRSIRLKESPHVGKKVAIIGGGNAAIDAARSALRLAADKVFVYYRRTRAEMPALLWEVEAAEAEGIEFRYLAAPVEILGKNGKVTGMKCIRMELGEKDASGRRRPIPIEDSAFIEKMDSVIPAISQSPDISFLDRDLELGISKWNTVIADETTCATKADGIFACGDAVTGPSTAIGAIAMGKKAAESIAEYLSQKRTDAAEEAREVVSYQDLDIGHVLEENRCQVPCLPPEKRVKHFGEVELGYSVDEAVKEATRCLQCGGCCNCRECEKVCEPKVINHEMREESIELNVQSVVVATGFEPCGAELIREYGYQELENVVTALEFERMISASGPTEGELQRPSDGRTPRRLAFIQCVGSRDDRAKPYCSAVCCMHATKEAILANEHHPDVKSFVFYTDLRAVGKRFQEYITRARSQYGVSFIRSRPGRITENAGTRNPVVWYEDTASQQIRKKEVDLVVLSQALVPYESNQEIADVLGVELDDYGFFQSKEKLVRPVDTSIPGIFGCGYCQSPQDIPDSVIQASAAAARAAEFLTETGKRVRVKRPVSSRGKG
jgi:heterodisulfide reductase subunit A-like polyferredoxin